MKTAIKIVISAVMLAGVAGHCAIAAMFFLLSIGLGIPGAVLWMVEREHTR